MGVVRDLVATFVAVPDARQRVRGALPDSRQTIVEGASPDGASWYIVTTVAPSRAALVDNRVGAVSAGVSAAVGERRPDMTAARAEVNRGLTDEPWLPVTVWIDEVEYPAEAIQLLCGAWAVWVASGESMIFVGVTGMAVEGVQLVTERQ